MGKKLEIREIFEEQNKSEARKQETNQEETSLQVYEKKLDLFAEVEARREAEKREEERIAQGKETLTAETPAATETTETETMTETPAEEESAASEILTETPAEAETTTATPAAAKSITERFPFIIKLQQIAFQVKQRISFDMLRKKGLFSKTNTDPGTWAKRFQFKRFNAFREFAEHYKKQLLIAFSIFLIMLVGAAGIFNYYLAYEYSYNGKLLGVVKNKEDVLKITDLVQNALTEDRDLQVVIDRKKDITFKRVPNIRRGLHLDTSEEVLKRMTYVGDINIKAYSIAINGKSTVFVDSNESAKRVLDEIKSDYTEQSKDSLVKTAKFVEDVEIKPVNTALQKLQKAEAAKETLKSGSIVEAKHKVKAKETLADLAKEYNMTEKEIEQLNPGMNPAKLEVGKQIKILKEAPLITLKTIEYITYEEEVKYKVVKEKTSKLYKGDQEVKKKGVKGKRTITAKVEKINGQEVKNEPIIETVEREPSTEYLLVGTTKRPPSVGDGRFIWPVSNFRFSSPFGYRWGRLHDGVDLACSRNAKVVAGDGGIVTFAGYKGSLGNLVIINHQHGGLVSYYGHNTSLTVKAGDKVYEGQQIAFAGSTGRSTGNHVHFKIELNGAAVNPVPYIKK